MAAAPCCSTALFRRRGHPFQRGLEHAIGFARGFGHPEDPLVARERELIQSRERAVPPMTLSPGQAALNGGWRARRPLSVCTWQQRELHRRAEELQLAKRSAHGTAVGQREGQIDHRPMDGSVRSVRSTWRSICTMHAPLPSARRAR